LEEITTDIQRLLSSIFFVFFIFFCGRTAVTTEKDEEDEIRKSPLER